VNVARVNARRLVRACASSDTGALDVFAGRCHDRLIVMGHLNAASVFGALLVALAEELLAEPDEHGPIALERHLDLLAPEALPHVCAARFYERAISGLKRALRAPEHERNLVHRAPDAREELDLVFVKL